MNKNTDLTIIDVLETHLEKKPNACAYGFLQYSGEKRTRIDITYNELYEKITSTAFRLSSINQPGDRVLLAFSPNQMKDFIIAFYGCLLAGLIAVPIYPPKINRSLLSFTTIINSCKPKTIIGLSILIQKIQAHVEQVLAQTFHWLAIDKLNDCSKLFRRPDLKSDSIAFLQYTSGSTGDPKGAMVSHSNIMANQHMIKKAFSHDEDSRFVGWLPLFHDMGLIGNVLHPLYLGVESILMAPACFLQEPLRWLQAISDFRAHTSGGPNFSYELSIKAYLHNKHKTNLDLSCWQVAFNGAEPIYAKTVEDFYSCFSEVGLKKGTMYPCYGLAEATLFVCGSTKQKPAVLLPIFFSSLKDGKIVEDENSDYALVSSGLINRDNNVKIVDPVAKKSCPDLVVSEVWISGDNVVKGYWQQIEVNKKQFSQKLSESHAEYFRTSDLGFIYNNQLFITGRIKDLIIIRGKNYYPQDIEQVAKTAHPSIKPDVAAAFSYSSKQSEVIVVVVEIKRSARHCNVNVIANAVINAVNAEVQIKPDEVVCVQAHGIPITSSGKVRRQATYELYNKRRLPYIDIWRTEQYSKVDLLDVKNILTELLSEKLQDQALCLSRSLGDYGLDSFDHVQLLAALSSRLGVTLELANLVECDSLTEVINYIESALSLSLLPEDRPIKKFENESVFQPFSILQRSLYFNQKKYPNSSYYLIERVFSVKSSRPDFNFIKCCEQLIDTYPILKSKISLKPELGLQYTSSLSELIKSITFVDKESFEKECYQCSEKIKCKEGYPLMQILVAKLNESSIKVYFGINHLIVDLWSIALIVNKFISLVSDKKENKMPVLYSNYVIYEKKLMKEEQHIYFWRQYFNQCLSGLTTLAFPILHTKKAHFKQKATLLNFRLVEADCNKISNFVNINRLTLFSFFISIYAFLLYKYTGQDKILIGSPFNNRGNSRFSETVGLFVNTLPLIFDIDPSINITAFLRQNHQMVTLCQKHQQLPLAKIFQCNEVFNKQIDYSHFIQALFTCQRVHTSQKACLNSLALNMEPYQVDIDRYLKFNFDPSLQTSESLFDLALIVDNEISGYLKYPSQQLPDFFVKQFLKHFLHAIQIFISNKDELLSNINLLLENEMRELLEGFNQDSVSSNYNDLLEIFETTVTENPNHLAVSDSKHSFTYSEFKTKVDALEKLL